MEKVCCIFAAGDFNGNFSKKDSDFIIAADAGYLHLEKLGIIPDILLGDFDTLKQVPNICETKKFPPEKDYTDTELAILEGLSLGYYSFTIYGALGGERLEHTIANIQMALKYTLLGKKIILTDGKSECLFLHNGKIEFDSNETGFISVFSLNGASRGITIDGLKYPLEYCETLEYGSLGVSNEFLGKPSSISVEDGSLLIIKKRR